MVQVLLLFKVMTDDKTLVAWLRLMRGITGVVVLLLSSACRRRLHRGFFEDSVLALEMDADGAELRHSRFQLFQVQRQRGGRRSGKGATGEGEEGEERNDRRRERWSRE